MKKIIILPIIFILLLSFASALTWDSTITFPLLSTCSGAVSECAVGGAGEIGANNFVHVSKKTTGTPIPSRIIYFNDAGTTTSHVNTSNYDAYNILASASDGTFIYSLTSESGNYIRKFYQNGTQISKSAIGSYVDIDFINGGFYMLKTNGSIDIYNAGFTSSSRLEPSYPDVANRIGLTYSSDYTLLVKDTTGDGVNEFYTDGSLYNTSTAVNKTASALQKASRVGDKVAFSTNSIFNRVLEVYTIDNPYTSDFTKDGDTFYSATYCVDADTLCTDTNFIYSFTNPSCTSITERTFCSGGCVNTAEVVGGDTYITGACLPDADCTNECLIEGETWCNSDFTYRTCGRDYDADTCLEWSSPTTCTLGSTCSVDVLGASCQAYNYSDFTASIIPPTWYIDIKDNDSEELVYTPVSNINAVQGYLSLIDLASAYTPLVPNNLPYFQAKYLSRQYDVSTSYSIVGTFFRVTLPDVSSDTPTYVAVDCDYKEDLLLRNLVQTSGNTTKTFTFDAIDDNIGVKFLFNPIDANGDDETNTTFYVLKDTTDYLLNITYWINTTYLRIYENGELVIDQLHPSGVEDIAGIMTSCDVSSDTLFYACSYDVARVYTSDTLYYGSAKELQDRPSPIFFDEMKLVPDENMTFYQLQLVKMPDKKGFVINNEDRYMHYCSAGSTGANVVRIYHTYNDMPFYMDYKDTIIDVNAIDSNNPTGTQELDDFGADISPLWKFLIVIISFVLIVGISLAFGFITDLIAVGVVFAGVLGVATLIFFALIGFISTLFVVLMVVFGALLSSLFLVRRI